MDGTQTITNQQIRAASFGTNLTNVGFFYNHYITFNPSGNVLQYVGGTLKAVIDATINTDRWADMRTRAYDSYDRTTAITYTDPVNSNR